MDKKEDKEKLSSQLEFKLNNSNIEEKSKENVNMANHKSFENENKNSIGEETIDDEDNDNFNLKLNLDNLKEEDKIILNTPQKLYKITGTKKSDLREYVLSDDFTKIYYLKKPKKYLFISKLEKVFNGNDPLLILPLKDLDFVPKGILRRNSIRSDMRSSRRYRNK